MRLQSFLLSEGRSTHVSSEFATDYIKKHCTDAIDAYNKGSKMYRGTTDKGDFALVKPSEYNRASAYASANFYTLLLDNLSEWKRYPKRSKSIVMSTDINKAWEYSDDGGKKLYVCLPVNGSKIGVCSGEDIWESFPSTLGNLGWWSDDMSSIYGDWASESWNLFKQTINDYDKEVTVQMVRRLKLTMNNRNRWFDKYADNIQDVGSSKPMLDVLTELFNPSKNGFKLMKVGDILPKYKEVWTDGDSILIDVDKDSDIIKGL